MIPRVFSNRELMDLYDAGRRNHDVRIINGLVESDFTGCAWYSHQGSVRYYVNGVIHRDGGLPAYISEGPNAEWFVDGLHHRYDGPACVGTNEPEDFYCIHGQRTTWEAFELLYMMRFGRVYDGQ